MLCVSSFAFRLILRVTIRWMGSQKVFFLGGKFYDHRFSKTLNFIAFYTSKVNSLPKI